MLDKSNKISIKMNTYSPSLQFDKKLEQVLVQNKRISNP